MCSIPKHHRSPFSSQRFNQDELPTLSVEAMKRFTETANKAQAQKEEREKDKQQSMPPLPRSQS